MTFSIDDLLAQAIVRLQAAHIHPAEREARWLMEHLLGFQLNPLANSDLLSSCQIDHYYGLLDQRLKHMPLQYILEKVDFVDLSLKVNPHVLIPRPETEYLVEIILSQIGNHKRSLLCADLGTGSGCLALALSTCLPNSKWLATDISTKALETAQQNAFDNKLAERIDFLQGSWFEPLPVSQKFDLIVSNPPYIPQREKLQLEVMNEPHRALFSGLDGLDDYRIIIPALKERLATQGLFMGEFGDGQTSGLTDIAQNSGFENIEFIRDLSQRNRYIKLINNQ